MSTKITGIQNQEIAIQIRDLLENNQLEEVQIFLQKYKCLNQCNVTLSYLFHITQSAGILVTTIATGYNKIELIWLGVGLNILASLFTVFKKTNNSMLDKLSHDIQSIKDGTFLVETSLTDKEEDKKELKV